MFVLSALLGGADDGGGDLPVSALFNFNTSTSLLQKKQRQSHMDLHTQSHTQHKCTHFFLFTKNAYFCWFFGFCVVLSNFSFSLVR